MMKFSKRACKHQQFRNKNSTGSEVSAVILQTNTIRHESLQRNKINKSVILTVEGVYISVLHSLQPVELV